MDKPTIKLIGYTSQYDLDFPFAHAGLGPKSEERTIPCYAVCGLIKEESAYDFVDRMIRKHGTCES
jgi:hypothetical protein